MSRCEVGTNFLGPAMAMERWQRSVKRRTERQPTILQTNCLPTSFKLTLLPQSFFFLSSWVVVVVAVVAVAVELQSGCGGSTWTQQQLSCKKGGGAHGNIQTKRFIQQEKDSSVFGFPCTLCISHLSYSLITHKLLSHLISLSPVLGGT